MSVPQTWGAVVVVCVKCARGDDNGRGAVVFVVCRWGGGGWESERVRGWVKHVVKVVSRRLVGVVAKHKSIYWRHCCAYRSKHYGHYLY